MSQGGERQNFGGEGIKPLTIKSTCWTLYGQRWEAVKQIGNFTIDGARVEVYVAAAAGAVHTSG